MLLCPWDSPGKNIGVGSHFLLLGIPQGSLCLPRPPAVLRCSAWTKLSTATLLASSRLWLSSAAAKEVQLRQWGTQGPNLGLPKPLKAPLLGPPPGMTLRGPTMTMSIQVSWRS